MRGKREFPPENPPLQVGMPINKSYKKFPLTSNIWTSLVKYKFVQLTLLKIRIMHLDIFPNL